MNINKIFLRVSQWNEKRYARQYNQALTIKLLAEEHQELLDASKPVDKLDALCDITYVAMGALWKRGVDNLTLGVMLNLSDCVKSLDHTSPKATIMLKQVILSALYEMARLELEDDQILKALEIVCDSNDTKLVKKTNGSCKGNFKGTGFVAPEPRLQKVLEGRLLCKI